MLSAEYTHGSWFASCYVLPLNENKLLFSERTNLRDLQSLLPLRKQLVWHLDSAPE